MSRRKEIRRGEKVPATVGTMADRFVKGELTALGDQGSVLVGDGTEASAVWTSGFLGQGVCLLVE